MFKYQMSKLFENTFEINFVEDFDNVPINTEKIIVNISSTNNKIANFLNNLPITLQEIYFNNDNYIFDETTNDENKSVMYNIKIPFGCKIYKIDNEIINPTGLIKINKRIELNFSHSTKELIYLIKNMLTK